MNEFSHLQPEGSVRMVDVGHKPEQERTAVAAGRIICQAETLQALKRQALPKGDALTVARVAGIQAAKLTAHLIPLCHPLPLNYVAVDFEMGETEIAIRCEVTTRSSTGVEMEALTGVTLAALTLYDMMKSADKTMRIEGIELLSKVKR
ncbi:MAG TPA: cyclic pyranopterin monophosphate synthase MoaC [Terrimicrobiaceae bacterium]|nr:cyclic pyranopterin monophosphate synthase MoaC [Terrimicrobiaceae bacterium]